MAVIAEGRRGRRVRHNLCAAGRTAVIHRLAFRFAFPLSGCLLRRSRLICPEYDKSAPEVKTFPPAAAPLFLLCWNISCGILNASLFPIKKDFRCCYSFTPGEHTQPHTHDYIELAYVVDGEFRQLILGREITFHSGDFCLIDRNCIHSDILQNGDSTVLFLGISRTLFDEIIQEKGTDQKITAFLQSALLKQKRRFYIVYNLIDCLCYPIFIHPRCSSEPLL